MGDFRDEFRVEVGAEDTFGGEFLEILQVGELAGFVSGDEIGERAFPHRGIADKRLCHCCPPVFGEFGGDVGLGFFESLGFRRARAAGKDRLGVCVGGFSLGIASSIFPIPDGDSNGSEQDNECENFNFHGGSQGGLRVVGDAKRLKLDAEQIEDALQVIVPVIGEFDFSFFWGVSQLDLGGEACAQGVLDLLDHGIGFTGCGSGGVCLFWV